MEPIVVLLIIANINFRDEEYLEPKNILEKAGIKVITASSSLKEAKGMLRAKAKIDITIDKVNVSNYYAIIFVGGSGATEYFDNKIAHRIAKEAISQNKIVGAICIAPVILAKAGLLKNKKATVFSSEKNELIKYGAIYSDKGVEVDGKIITASGPKFAKEFGEKIKALLLEM
ncbi:MAG TPA: DJ-1/PfpI family protein [Spirochaetota bacterium]|nr:DJ-1/PfpI family protein [Spirochaetota bacterium]HOL58116.1 DJ-1/PfpI family protein [Spirochaetota bacterium]HPP05574.1 DJ-1/PfpI family protein [Spirochaetota bacterium]